MKALSINQPWAWLIVNGFKAVENRNWSTNFRGDFLIHAGKRFDKDGYDFIKERFPQIPLPSKAELDTEMGGIVGKARLVGCAHYSQKQYLSEKDRPWFFGEYGFILDSAEATPFKPCKGELGFFTPDYNSSYAPPKRKVKS